jgi:hypothetical protein
MSRAGCVLASLLTAACQGVTEPRELPVVLNTASLVGSVTPATISVDGQRLVVRGFVGTPDPCYRFSARAIPRGEMLHLQIEARPLDGTCIQVVGTFSYELTVSDVPSGRWSVRLDATQRGRAGVTRLAEGSVLVP